MAWRLTNPWWRMILSEVDAEFGPTWPRLGKFAFAASYGLLRPWMARRGVHTLNSAYATSLIDGLKLRMSAGEKLYLAGINVTEHNSGIGMVEVSERDGIVLICNEEEERYRAEKHYSGYPTEAAKSIKRHLEEIGIGSQGLSAIAGSYDFTTTIPSVLKTMAEHLPRSLAMLHPDAAKSTDLFGSLGFAEVPGRLQGQLDLAGPAQVVVLNHHDNHAALSYGVSPFADSAEPVIVAVLDGYGDTESISIHIGENGRLRRLWSNESLVDSLGLFYAIISSTQGGWTPLSSEGRYMGAAAWGDSNRLTNPYYRGLREIFHFSDSGRVYLNKSIANWHVEGERRPYTRRLERLMGPPIPMNRMWNPDAVLNVEDVQHPTTTRERVDKAAATQLVFEDVMFHIVGHLLRTTGSDKLVLTGGTALNCVCNMRLLDTFDKPWFRRNCGRDTRLQLWVPPVPGDAGIPIGAAYNLGLRLGARPSQPLDHAFYCGFAPSRKEVEQSFVENSEIGFLAFGEIGLTVVADFVAFALSRDAVLGIFQGPAETGPRALGHRSILANPCNPATLDVMNRLVKHREPIRPLAPMVTLKAAQELFHLSEGANARDYNAYSFMNLTAYAKPAAIRLIPAVIHRDGTARLQIVSPGTNPFAYSILEAMGRRLGVEVAVNTSLNVGSPIVQSVNQALGALQRSRGMSGLILISEGQAYMAWHAIEGPIKDAGRSILKLHSEWIEASSNVEAKLTLP
jgi:carbamoyltransferase